MKGKISSLFEFLPWDSKLFNIRIARIKSNSLNRQEINHCKRWCFDNNINCIYYLIDPDKINSIYLAESNGFHLVDIRVTLETDLLVNPYVNIQSQEIMPLTRAATRNDIDEIKKIAGKNHYQTRFFKDKRFPRDKSAELYKLWIKQGFEDIHGIVLVAQVKKKIAGYIVLQMDDNYTGIIGLTGVDKNFRNKGVGAALIGAALNWFKVNGAKRATVVTQGNNMPAMRLYSKFGFLTFENMLWYHRWFE
jgi:RimJ/RimL family protein N-acetyltransferase